MQEAIDCEQLDKFDDIVALQRYNFDTLQTDFYVLKEFILPEPQHNSKPNWFGFSITVYDDVEFTGI